MVMNVIGGFNHCINKYLDFLFMISNTPICKFTIIKFVIPIALLFNNDLDRESIINSLTKNGVLGASECISKLICYWSKNNITF